VWQIFNFLRDRVEQIIRDARQHHEGGGRKGAIQRSSSRDMDPVRLSADDGELSGALRGGAGEYVPGTGVAVGVGNDEGFCDDAGRTPRT
jgi:hypothetical protein